MINNSKQVEKLNNDIYGITRQISIIDNEADIQNSQGSKNNLNLGDALNKYDSNHSDEVEKEVQDSEWYVSNIMPEVTQDQLHNAIH